MKKSLLALALLGLVFATESITNAAFWGLGSYNTPADYPTCCQPQSETKGCRTRCCRKRIIGRPRWTCCRTLRCCKPKKACCPRYKCCKPKPACCPTEVPVCETSGCVTTPRTTCYEDPAGIATYSNGAEGTTTCTEDVAGSYDSGSYSYGSYSTSYGEPSIHNSYSGYQEIVG